MSDHTSHAPPNIARHPPRVRRYVKLAVCEMVFGGLNKSARGAFGDAAVTAINDRFSERRLLQDNFSRVAGALRGRVLSRARGRSLPHNPSKPGFV